MLFAGHPFPGATAPVQLQFPGHGCDAGRLRYLRFFRWLRPWLLCSYGIFQRSACDNALLGTTSFLTLCYCEPPAALRNDGPSHGDVKPSD